MKTLIGLVVAFLSFCVPLQQVDVDVYSPTRRRIARPLVEQCEDELEAQAVPCRPGWCDRLVALAVLIVASPVLLIAGVAILLDSGRPIWFRQMRVGHHGRSFQLLKFRSMRQNAGGVPITKAGDHRVTRIGRILRRFKLDEFPQFWNVVRGEMALIGPRPEVAEWVDVEDPLWRTVLSVPPGITDLASLVYRDEEAILAESDDIEDCYRSRILPDKLRLRAHYIQTRTWRSDLKVLALTAVVSVCPGLSDPDRIRRGFALDA